MGNGCKLPGSKVSTDVIEKQPITRANTSPNTTSADSAVDGLLNLPTKHCVSPSAAGSDSGSDFKDTAEDEIASFADFRRLLTMHGRTQTVMHGHGGIVVANGTYLAHQFVNSVQPPYTAVPAKWIEKGADALSLSDDVGRVECGSGDSDAEW